MSSDILVVVYHGDSLMVAVFVDILVSPVTRFVSRSASRSGFLVIPPLF